MSLPEKKRIAYRSSYETDAHARYLELEDGVLPSLAEVKVRIAKALGLEKEFARKFDLKLIDSNDPNRDMTDDSELILPGSSLIVQRTLWRPVEDVKQRARTFVPDWVQASETLPSVAPPQDFPHLPSRFICAICNGLLRNAMAIRCSNACSASVCKPCAERRLQESTPALCPECKQPTVKNFIPNKALIAIISKLNISSYVLPHRENLDHYSVSPISADLPAEAPSIMKPENTLTAPETNDGPSYLVFIRPEQITVVHEQGVLLIPSENCDLLDEIYKSHTPVLLLIFDTGGAGTSLLTPGAVLVTAVAELPGLGTSTSPRHPAAGAAVAAGNLSQDEQVQQREAWFGNSAPSKSDIQYKSCTVQWELKFPSIILLPGKAQPIAGIRATRKRTFQLDKSFESTKLSLQHRQGVMQRLSQEAAFARMNKPPVKPSLTPPIKPESDFIYDPVSNAWSASKKKPSPDQVLPEAQWKTALFMRSCFKMNSFFARLQPPDSSTHWSLINPLLPFAVFFPKLESNTFEVIQTLQIMALKMLQNKDLISTQLLTGIHEMDEKFFIKFKPPLNQPITLLPTLPPPPRPTPVGKQYPRAEQLPTFVPPYDPTQQPMLRPVVPSLRPQHPLRMRPPPPGQMLDPKWQQQAPGGRRTGRQWIEGPRRLISTARLDPQPHVRPIDTFKYSRGGPQIHTGRPMRPNHAMPNLWPPIQMMPYRHLMPNIQHQMAYAMPQQIPFQYRPNQPQIMQTTRQFMAPPPLQYQAQEQFRRYPDMFPATNTRPGPEPQFPAVRIYDHPAVLHLEDTVDGGFYSGLSDAQTHNKIDSSAKRKRPTEFDNDETSSRARIEYGKRHSSHDNIPTDEESSEMDRRIARQQRFGTIPTDGHRSSKDESQNYDQQPADRRDLNFAIYERQTAESRHYDEVPLHSGSTAKQSKRSHEQPTFPPHHEASIPPTNYGYRSHETDESRRQRKPSRQYDTDKAHKTAKSVDSRKVSDPGSKPRDKATYEKSSTKSSLRRRGNHDRPESIYPPDSHEESRSRHLRSAKEPNRNSPRDLLDAMQTSDRRDRSYNPASETEVLTSRQPSVTLRKPKIHEWPARPSDSSLSIGVEHRLMVDSSYNKTLQRDRSVVVERAPDANMRIDEKSDHDYPESSKKSGVSTQRMLDISVNRPVSGPATECHSRKPDRSDQVRIGTDRRLEERRATDRLLPGANREVASDRNQRDDYQKARRDNSVERGREDDRHQDSARKRGSSRRQETDRQQDNARRLENDRIMKTDHVPPSQFTWIQSDDRPANGRSVPISSNKCLLDPPVNVHSRSSGPYNDHGSSRQSGPDPNNPRSRNSDERSRPRVIYSHLDRETSTRGQNNTTTGPLRSESRSKMSQEIDHRIVTLSAKERSGYNPKEQGATDQKLGVIKPKVDEEGSRRPNKVDRETSRSAAEGPRRTPEIIVRSVMSSKSSEPDAKFNRRAFRNESPEKLLNEKRLNGRNEKIDTNHIGAARLFSASLPQDSHSNSPSKRRRPDNSPRRRPDTSPRRRPDTSPRRRPDTSASNRASESYKPPESSQGTPPSAFKKRPKNSLYM